MQLKGLSVPLTIIMATMAVEDTAAAVEDTAAAVEDTALVEDMALIMLVKALMTVVLGIMVLLLVVAEAMAIPTPVLMVDMMEMLDWVMVAAISLVPMRVVVMV
jgi:hypothetical protein